MPVHMFGKQLARSAGLTAAQLRVLQLVAEKEVCTAKEISLRMRVSQATITSLVDKLVLKGAVVREKSRTDRRQTNILITEKGREALAAVPDPLQQRYVTKFSELEEWEQTMLVSALERVAAMLDAEDLDVAPVLDSRDFSDAT